MAHKSELLFVDPLVPDLNTLLENLRPEVRAIVLDGARPAARQMAEALVGIEGLDAIHIVAHGAPGRVCFTSGEWSVDTLPVHAKDLARIGSALAQEGDVRLWSCDVARGSFGASFIGALEHEFGAGVAAACGPIGDMRRGGTWRLERSNCNGQYLPFAPEMQSTYAGLLAVVDDYVTISGSVGNGSGHLSSGTYYIETTIGGVVTVVGSFTIPNITNVAFQLNVLVSSTGNYTVVNFFGLTVDGTSSGETFTLTGPNSNVGWGVRNCSVERQAVANRVATVPAGGVLTIICGDREFLAKAGLVDVGFNEKDVVFGGRYRKAELGKVEACLIPAAFSIVSCQFVKGFRACRPLLERFKCLADEAVFVAQVSQAPCVLQPCHPRFFVPAFHVRALGKGCGGFDILAGISVGPRKIKPVPSVVGLKVERRFE